MQSLEQSGQSLRFAMVNLCSSYVGRGREGVRNVYSEQLIQIIQWVAKPYWYPGTRDAIAVTLRWIYTM